MILGGYVCVSFEAIRVSWVMFDRRHELCVNKERVLRRSAYATSLGYGHTRAKNISILVSLSTQWFLDILPTLFSRRIPCLGLSTLCMFCPHAPSIYSPYRFKSSPLRYFPLVYVRRRLHPRLCYESGLAQYLPVLAMCCLQATRGTGVALLQVTAHRTIWLHHSVR